LSVEFAGTVSGKIRVKESSIPMAAFAVGNNTKAFDAYCRLAEEFGEQVVPLLHPVRAHISYMHAQGEYGKNDTVYKLLRAAWHDDVASKMTRDKLQELAYQ